MIFVLLSVFFNSFNNFYGYYLLDVNNDNNKDFIIVWKPVNKSSGKLCDVHLLRYDNLHFAEEVSFSEPVFYPQKKLVRGLEYGYGATYYKFKWNNNYIVDTIEYVYSTY